MRKKLLFLIGVLLSTYSIGQNLTFDQLISLRTKNIASVEEFLVSKNWEMLNITDPYPNGEVHIAFPSCVV